MSVSAEKIFSIKQDMKKKKIFIDSIMCIRKQKKKDFEGKKGFPRV